MPECSGFWGVMGGKRYKNFHNFIHIHTAPYDYRTAKCSQREHLRLSPGRQCLLLPSPTRMKSWTPSTSRANDSASSRLWKSATIESLPSGSPCSSTTHVIRWRCSQDHNLSSLFALVYLSMRQYSNRDQQNIITMILSTTTVGIRQ